jgi:hypothetical protein
MAFNSYIDVIKLEALSCTTTVPEYGLGVRTHQSGNEYVYVYNAAANSKITTGQYCVVDGGGSSYSSGYSVTVTNASLNGYLAGVAQQTFNTATYGWVMTKGVSLIALDSGAVSMNVDAQLALGTDGGFVAAGATFSTAPRFGVALNSLVTTVGTGKARIFGSVL